MYGGCGSLGSWPWLCVVLSLVVALRLLNSLSGNLSALEPSSAGPAVHEVRLSRFRTADEMVKPAAGGDSTTLFVVGSRVHELLVSISRGARIASTLGHLGHVPIQCRPSVVSCGRVTSWVNSGKENCSMRAWESGWQFTSATSSRRHRSEPCGSAPPVAPWPAGRSPS